MQISIQENFFVQGIGINKEFSSKTDTVFKVSFPRHFSAVGLCLTVRLNFVSWLWKAMVMEYLRDSWLLKISLL